MVILLDVDATKHMIDSSIATVLVEKRFEYQLSPASWSSSGIYL